MQNLYASFHFKLGADHVLGRAIAIGTVGQLVRVGFGISDDFIEKYQSLDAKFIKNKFSTFFFEAVGDSMEPTIFEGQVLIVDRSLKDFHQKVCVISNIFNVDTL